MSFTLRPYQQKFADEIIKALAKYRQILACSATGSGKTKTFIYLAKRAHAKGLTVLVLTEATKIYDQLTAELPAGNINSEIKDGYIAPGNIYIAMAQTLSRRIKMIQQFQELGQNLLIINDEAHIGTATKLLLQLLINDPMLIGFTATPDFRFAKHLPLLYKACIVGPQPDELVNDGFLCSYQHFARVRANMDELKIKNGEFTEESQERVFESKRVFDGLIEDLRNTTFKRAIVFTSSIKHCDHVTSMLNENNFNAFSIHSKSPTSDQAFDMAQYKDLSTPINICVSVGVLTKGFDFPAIDLIVLNRATTSLPLFLQMIGRGSRTSEGKSVFRVLDYGENYKRHGLWDSEIDWAKKWNQKPKKKEGVAPVRMCPICDFINSTSSTKCTNCGHEFIKIVTEDEKSETKIIELTAVYRTLIGRKISTLSPKELALYAKLKNKKPFAARIAKSHTQTGRPNFIHEYGAAMGYKQYWAQYNEPNGNEGKVEFTDITLR